MSDVVNLRQFRKRKNRAEKEEAAAANRKQHGISKVELKRSAAKRDVEKRKLDGKRLTPEA
ncbi:MAG: DUF4169 family protein [Pseudomonadota bacterium]